MSCAPLTLDDVAMDGAVVVVAVAVDGLVVKDDGLDKNDGLGSNGGG